MRHWKQLLLPECTLLIKAFPLFGSSGFERAQRMFNSSLQSGCPHFPPYLLPSKCLPGKPSQHEGRFPAPPGAGGRCQAAFPGALLSRYLKVICGSAPRNLLGRSEAGCKPRFSDLRWFKRPQFVELLHEYLMIIFLGCLEAKKMRALITE